MNLQNFVIEQAFSSPGITSNLQMELQSLSAKKESVASEQGRASIGIIESLACSLATESALISA
jgi:hypothetical protein